jgi:hypothetical protein
MNAEYQSDDLPATPEYVLSVLKDWLRQVCNCGEGDPNTGLTFETTVRQWQDAMLDDGIILWWAQGRWLNREWGIHCSREEWRAALKPARERTLRDVCGLIARHARRPGVRPWRFIGGECLPAGVFLTVRSLLHRAGVDVSAVAPSTPLASYLGRYSSVMLPSLIHLAPGALPPVRLQLPLVNTARLVIFLGLLVELIGLFAGAGMFVVPLLGLALLFVGLVLTSMIVGPQAELGELRTFRDLSLHLAAHSIRSSATQ